MPVACTLSLKFFLLNLIIGKGGKFSGGFDINVFEKVHKTGNCLVDLLYEVEVGTIPDLVLMNSFIWLDRGYFDFAGCIS